MGHDCHLQLPTSLEANGALRGSSQLVISLKIGWKIKLKVRIEPILTSEGG